MKRKRDMEYPIIEAGERAGVLSVGKDGLYTVFEGRLPPSGELTRLWVAGGGKSACLGLMEPGKEGRRLCRRLSRAAMAGFPEHIEYAATARPQTEPEVRKLPEIQPEPVTVPVPEPAAEMESAASEPAEATEPEGAGDGAAPEEGPEDADDGMEPNATGPPSEGLLWFSRPDGSLTAYDGRRMLLALPAELRHRWPGLRLRVINGREYILFWY